MKGRGQQWSGRKWEKLLGIDKRAKVVGKKTRVGLILTV